MLAVQKKTIFVSFRYNWSVLTTARTAGAAFLSKAIAVTGKVLENVTSILNVMHELAGQFLLFCIGPNGYSTRLEIPRSGVQVLF